MHYVVAFTIDAFNAQTGKKIDQAQKLIEIDHYFQGLNDLKDFSISALEPIEMDE